MIDPFVSRREVSIIQFIDTYTYSQYSLLIIVHHHLYISVYYNYIYSLLYVASFVFLFTIFEPPQSGFVYLNEIPKSL